MADSRTSTAAGQPKVAAAPPWRDGRARRRVAAGLLAVLLSAPAPVRSAAAVTVDLELVLAVDVSSSISRREYQLQMQGLAQAFRSREVIETIVNFAPRGVAVSLFQWGGVGEHATMVPWLLVMDAAGAETVAAAIDRSLRLGENSGTALGEAIRIATEMFEASGYEGARRVIDVSGDGHANVGIAPSDARAAALAAGITVNGLVILNEEPELDRYYSAHVIGGEGAFLIDATDFEDFARAIRAKLVREIGGDRLVEAPSEDGGAGPVLPLRPGPEMLASRSDLGN